MKKSLILIGITGSLFLICCKRPANTAEIQKRALDIFGPIPAAMPGAENDTPELVELGKKLYFEKRLSVNDTIACNSCHILDDKKGGVDNLPTSPGAHQKNGGRNSPTVLNAGFHIAQFWDGRAKTLADQAKGPILNPIEMSMPTEKEVVAKLKGIAEYPPLFNKAFPKSKESITYDNLANAIAAFERTLRTEDRFDDFQNGDLTALSAKEIEGLDLFMNTGCIQCHNGPVIGGNSFQKLGVIHPYANTQDTGRFEITKQEADKFVFKVPSLRNVALTAPYFHDGGAETLQNAVKQMAHMQLGKELDDKQIDLIVTFLNSLTDKTRQ